jgi:hypothetical protein
VEEKTDLRAQRSDESGIGAQAARQRHISPHQKKRAALQRP